LWAGHLHVGDVAVKCWWFPLVLFGAGCASSPAPAPNPSFPEEGFHFLGNNLICIVKTKEADDPHACYQIGAIKIGAPYLPKVNPQEELTLPNGVVASMFPIIRNDQHHAYWVLGHKGGRIVSVQLTGTYHSPDYAFASIMLGDAEEKVRNVLGPRYTIRGVEAIGGVMWDYAPFKISVELVAGKVYSIRVADENL
jgi:hypothetical protein